MTNACIPLNTLKTGDKCIVNKLICDGALRRRLLDLGIINGTTIEVLQKSLSNDPVAYYIRGAVIALRHEITSTILVKKIEI